MKKPLTSKLYTKASDSLTEQIKKELEEKDPEEEKANEAISKASVAYVKGWTNPGC